ncbi:MAG: hypothetical protein SFY92_09595, partial [Verrucomicrobiae bacterium]|nr:hypothetical protein [Verrucomicrobiae bacterium]
MAIHDYYLGRQKIDTKGLQFFLKQLQLRESSGGGRALLGSIVDYIDPLGEMTYVVPASITTPQILLNELVRRREEYGIGEPTLVRDIAPGSETMRLTRKNTFQNGVGPFPGIPFNFGLSLDYSRNVTITMTHGEGSYYEYIPMAYLARIYNRVKGKPTRELGGRLLLEEAVVIEALFAREYSVSFESSQTFGPAFEAKLKAFNLMPDIGGKVALT